MATAWTSTPSDGFRPFVRNLLIKLDKICQPTRLAATMSLDHKVKTGSPEREAIVGKQAELIGARSHRAGHPKRTEPGRPRRARRLRAADIHPLAECCRGSPRRVQPKPVGGAWAGEPTPGRRERPPREPPSLGLALSVTPPSVIRNRQHGGAFHCRASRRPSDC